MIKKLLFIFVSLSIPSLIFSQTFRHPYSYYGIGELQNYNFITCQSLGGLGYAWNDSLTFSNTNPASYSNIRYTTFDIGMKMKIQGLEQGQKTEWTNYISFAYASFGFPVIKKYNWGLSFGLLPVSRTGYKIYSSSLIDSSLTIETFDIQGGINKLYIGSSISPIKNLNLGFNFSYVFGNNTRDHSFEYVNNTSFLGITKLNFISYYGIGLDIGLQYKNKLNKDLEYTLGAAYSIPVDLSSKKENTTFTYKNTASLNLPKDTIEAFKGSISNMLIPQNFGVGGILQKKNVWKVGFDFKYEKWSDFEPEIDEYALNDQWSAAIGAEIVPKYNQIKYLQRVAYRGGFRYGGSFLNVYGEKFTKMSAIIGFGFPISRNLSRINLSFEYGSVGNSSPLIIKENFFNIYMGFQLNDIWFIKSKYF
jgi:hypothetical protein